MLIPFPTHNFSSTMTSLIETLATTGQHQVASRVRAQLCGQTLGGEDEDHVVYGLMGNIESPLYIYSDKSKSMTYSWQCHRQGLLHRLLLYYLYYQTTCVDSKTDEHKQPISTSNNWVNSEHFTILKLLDPHLSLTVSVSLFHSSNKLR